MMAPSKMSKMPRMMPFYWIAYANEMVPEPRVAAIREKMEPLVPPARNFL